MRPKPDHRHSIVIACGRIHAHKFIRNTFIHFHFGVTLKARTHAYVHAHAHAHMLTIQQLCIIVKTRYSITWL